MGKITAWRGVVSAAAVFTLLLSSCSFGPRAGEETESVMGESCNINAVVMTADDSESITFDQLRNGIAANVNVTRETKLVSLDSCDILYLDEDAADAQGFDPRVIEDYVYNGGAVVLDNAMVPSFSNEFLGAAEVVHIDGCPAFMEYPEISPDLEKISELLYDYTSAFKGYTNYPDYE
ncbi:MAG: hypothetical protein ACI38A_04910, partial [Candidatus Ornithomonoglobus sp.]